MKTLQEFILESIEEIDVQLYNYLFEDTTTTGITNPDSPPLFKTTKFMNVDCLEVDSNTYSKCIQGKIPFKRWKGYTDDSSLESELKRMYHRNKKLLIKDSKTGSMVFIK